MATDLKALEAKLKGCADLKQSCNLLLNEVADALDGLTNDPVAIKALAADLRTHCSALCEAACSRTPKAAPAHQAPVKGGK